MMTKNYGADYTIFGGRIYNYDFEGYNSMADIASRIITDSKFDKKCAKNVKDRERKNQYE